MGVVVVEGAIVEVAIWAVLLFVSHQHIQEEHYSLDDVPDIAIFHLRAPPCFLSPN